MDAYLAWTRDYRHAAAETLETRRRGVGEFLAALGAKATVGGLSELDGGQVERFFLAYAETKGLAARRSTRAALRTFFRSCLHAGHIVRRLDHAVPALRAHRLSQPPRWLDPIAVSEPPALKVQVAEPMSSDMVSSTRMVAEGHSLKEVADVLGHRRVSTTFHYTKVDLKVLGSVALDWPEGVGP